jgi:signal transduction histidine kinase
MQSPEHPPDTNAPRLPREEELLRVIEDLYGGFNRAEETLSAIRRAQQEAGRLVPVNLDTVIREEISTFPGASIRHLDVHVEVLADGLLPTIFTNLIGNAVKFAAPISRSPSVRRQRAVRLRSRSRIPVSGCRTR